MKRIHSIIFSLIIVFFFIPATAGAIEIGLAWSGQSGMANRVSQGFEKGIRELAPQINVEVRKELGSMEELSRVVKSWENQKKGMVLLRSNAAKWLGKNPPGIPTFIGGCNNPEQLGAIKNLKAPEGLITGVSYYLPPDGQFEVFQSILPNMKSILLLVAKGNPSALVDQKGTRQTCQKLGLSYAEVECTDINDALTAVKAVTDNRTIIVIGNQSLIFDNTQKVVEAARLIPVVAYSDRAVKLGALGGFVANDEKLGYMLARTVVDVLVNGKQIRSVPVKFDTDPNFFVNLKTSENLGIELPYAILQAATIIE